MLSFATAFAAQDGSEPELVDLFPAEKADWTFRNLVAGVTTLVRGPSYWYANRELLVETVPAGAELALYYIRYNFQKRYERAVAPVRVLLPKRIHATSKDFVTIRAAAQGYLTSERRIRVHDLPDKVMLQLDPLPNSLVFLGHTNLGGRNTLTLRTTEEPEVRISKPRGAAGVTLAFTQTADKLEMRPAIASGHVQGVSLSQVGEDLLVRVQTDEPDLELRSKAHYDPIREEHVLVFDFMREGTRRPDSAEVRREIEAVRFAPGDRCAAAFGAVLRERLDPQVLARAFRPSGGLAEYYQREAMLRLGRARQGVVEDLAGERYRTGSPIEVALALQSAGSIRGYLGLLGEIARSQDEPEAFVHALVAPDLPSDEFSGIYREAVAARAACRGQSVSGGAAPTLAALP